MPTTAVGEEVSRDRTTFKPFSSLWYSIGTVTFDGIEAVRAAAGRAGGCWPSAAAVWVSASAAAAAARARTRTDMKGSSGIQIRGASPLGLPNTVAPAFAKATAGKRQSLFAPLRRSFSEGGWARLRRAWSR